MASSRDEYTTSDGAEASTGGIWPEEAERAAKRLLSRDDSDGSSNDVTVDENEEEHERLTNDDERVTRDLNFIRAGSPEMPHVTASLALFHVFSERRIMHWHDTWYCRGSDGAWLEKEPSWMRAVMYSWLADETYVVPRRDARGRAMPGEFDVMPWNPTQGRITAVLDALAAQVHLAAEAEVPSWLEEAGDGTFNGRPASGTSPMVNGLMTASSRRLEPHSSSFFCTWSLPFEYDKSARCPAWESYLHSVLDEESINLLQEWTGYVISGRTDLEKMMALYGPPRSGKGTYAWVLSQLIGERNVAGLSMATFGGEFALQPLLGKPLAVFDDARITRGLEIAAQMERLLSITGRGYLPVNRKNRSQVSCQLPCRVMLMSNDLPEWPDAAGALPHRTLVIEYHHSFLGREDSQLRNRFLPEMPGILNWALDGADRLQERGEFTNPALSQPAHQEMIDASNSVIPFVREHCQLGSEHVILCDELFQYYSVEHGGFKDPATQKRRFGQMMKKAFPQVSRIRTRQYSDNGANLYYYTGITLVNRLPDFARQ